tara:strand:- start:2310 stop:3242 length:933 start_codon:yes stop_codon:yes gene_type:complete
MLRSLVVGGTGFIGSHIANSLVSQGYEVIVIGSIKRNKSEYYLHSKIKTFFVDLSNIEQLKLCGIDWKFNLVINCCGYVDHSPFLDAFDSVIGTHLIGTLNIIKLIYSNHLTKYIHLGSSDEYGKIDYECKESIRESPLTPYSYSKVASTYLLQMLANSENFPSVIVRPFLVYGSNQKPNRLLPFVVQSCLKDKEFELTHGMQVRDFLYISDFVEAINCLIQAPIEIIRGKIYNVSSGKSISLYEVINLIVKITGGGRPQFGKKIARKTESQILKSNSENFRNTFDWQPKVSLNEGISKLVKFTSQNNVN